MGSTRLPGKVMLPILGKPMLVHVVERVRRTRLIDDIIIATSASPQDDVLVELCRAREWKFFRGSEEDVLDRYYNAAQDAEHIVRITSDCPVIDPTVIDYVVAGYYAAYPKPDYAANTLIRSYPRGLDVEIFNCAALAQAWDEDHNPATREHVTPYLYRHPDKFRLLSVSNPTDFSAYRLTVDTPEDFELIERIYAHFQHNAFGWREMIALLEQHLDWLEINREVPQKPVG